MNFVKKIEQALPARSKITKHNKYCQLKTTGMQHKTLVTLLTATGLGLYFSFKYYNHVQQHQQQQQEGNKRHQEPEACVPETKPLDPACLPTYNPAPNQTLIILRAQVLHRGITGALLKRMEQRGFTITYLQMHSCKHSKHKLQQFVPVLKKEELNQPFIVLILQGPNNSIVQCLSRMHDLSNNLYSINSNSELIYVSKTEEAAKRDVALWLC